MNGRRAHIAIGAGIIIALAGATIAVPSTRVSVSVVSAAGGTCVGDVGTAGLNTLFSAQADEYVGLDALRAYPLPDGRTLWLFQDAYFSPAGAPMGTLGAARFAHNAALVQTGNCFHALHGPSTGGDRCPGAGTASYVGGSLTINCTRWLWPMGGAMGADGYLHVFYAMFGNAVGAGADRGAAADGVWIARIDPSTLQVATLRPAPDHDGTLLYGWSVQTSGAHTYLFANSYDQFNSPDHTSPAPSRTYVARVPAGRFDLIPEYWNGIGWIAEREAAVPIEVLAAGSPDPSTSARYSLQPRLIDGVWVSVTKIDDWFGSDLAIDTASVPQGPWTRLRTIAVPTKTIDGTTNNYLPHLLPWRSPLGNLMIAMSHNAWRMNPVAYANPWLYRPSIFEVEAPAEMPSLSLPPSTRPLGFVPAGPQRALDTRSGVPLSAGEVRRVPLTGLVAAGAEVAAVNLLVVDPLADGFLTAFDCDRPRPWASNLNIAVGATQAAFALVELSGRGEICVFSSAPAHLVVDVFGSYVDRNAARANSFASSEPRRLIDTRLSGARTTPGVPLRVGVAAGVTAVAINLAATESLAAGYVTAYPCDQPTPATSNLNIGAAQTLSNFAQVAVSAHGELCVVSNVATHVVIDLVGQFSAAPDGWWYRATAPTRLVDSRVGIGVPVGPITRFVYGAPSTPTNSEPALTALPDSAMALVITAAAVNPHADGWLTVAPCSPRLAYTTATLNTTVLRTMANMSVVSMPRATFRHVCMFSMMPAHHLLDLSGWYEAA